MLASEFAAIRRAVNAVVVVVVVAVVAVVVDDGRVACADGRVEGRDDGSAG
jgi:hypothetical protein